MMVDNAIAFFYPSELIMTNLGVDLDQLGAVSPTLGGVSLNERHP
jgi:hypothetical protein